MKTKNCPRCGAVNAANASKCAYCGTPFVSDNWFKQNKLLVIILSLVLVFAILLVSIGGALACNMNSGGRRVIGGSGGGGGNLINIGEPSTDVSAFTDEAIAVVSRIGELNGGIIPEMVFNQNNIPAYIDGQYTEASVTNFDSAISSLNDIKPLMQMTDPASEYVGTEKISTDSRDYYRLQQVSNGVNVYNSQIIVETNKFGKVIGLVSDYNPVIDVSPVPVIDVETGRSSALNAVSASIATDGELYYYEAEDNHVLTWVYSVGSGEFLTHKVFISAEDGSVVKAVPLGEGAATTGTDAFGNHVQLSVSQRNGVYYMEDTSRNLSVYDSNYSNSSGSMVQSSSDIWHDSDSVTVMNNMTKIIDYYANVVGTPAIWSSGLGSVKVFVRYRQNPSTPYNNAFSSHLVGDPSATVLAFGDGKNYVESFDVAAHEFTHSIIRATCDLEYENQSGALNEAYADILGNLIQNEVMGTTVANEWLIGEELDGGAIRSMSSPNDYGNPEKVGGRYMHSYCYEDHVHSNCDNGGVHTNSGIVAKAAYLMYQGGLNNRQELITLFSRSLNYMTPYSDFLDCRSALIRSAKDMGMDETKIAVINEAFEQVGIVYEGINWPSLFNGTLSGRVADAVTSEPIQNVEIVIGRNDEGEGAALAYTDANGDFSAKAPAGTYDVYVTKPGYMSNVVRNVEIRLWETTYLEQTILLTEMPDDPLCQVGGMITNAVSGLPVEGATVMFRAEWGNRDGAYVTNANGNALTLTSNSDGEYFTGELTYGYYTAEVSRSGYATQYVNIVASTHQDASLHQNVILAPNAEGNTFRITLEWGPDPRDEDSHIVATYPSGHEYHVYYRNKNAYNNGERVANLDHDDTQGNGFETITLSAEEGVVYKYYVHKYAGNGSLAISNAKVKVYQGDVMVAQYNVPTNQGDGIYWNVFKIENGDVIGINQISSEPM